MSKTDKKTILIVDDSVVYREALKRDLKGFGFNTMAAADPNECLKILSSSSTKISLGFIDVEMPFMNGFELIEMIQAHPSYADIPLVMLTSRHEKEYIRKAIKAGAVDYIGKPFDKKILLKKINKHIKD